ncbi:MAG: hypothetical protein V4697_00825 [Patescibacteria group bacterium]
MKIQHAWFLFTMLGVFGVRAAEPVLERGPHHRTTVVGGGQAGAQARKVELATGLHYRSGEAWIETREVIEAAPGGAAASYGPHKVTFAANLNTYGAIQLLDENGQQFTSHVLGLAYTDAGTGESVLIAAVKDSTGQILPPNQILYADAFTDLQADVRYTYRRDGFEQDIILREQLPSPAGFGLNPETTRLEVLTEYVNAPEGSVTTKLLRAEENPALRQVMALPDFADQTLHFGAMKIGEGRAFALDGSFDIAVGKSWEVLNGRSVLIEAVEIPALQPALQTLPAGRRAQARPSNGFQRAALPTAPGRKVVGRSFPKAPSQRAQARPIPTRQTAQLQKQPGVVIDYNMTLTSGKTNYTFEPGASYTITGPVQMYGTTTIKGGAVVYYYATASNPYISLNGAVVCDTTPYRPAIFTAIDDAGQFFPDFTGPVGSYYARTALRASTTVTGELHDLRFNFAQTAIDWEGSTERFYNLQFMNCSNAIRRSNGGTNFVHNILATNVVNLFVGDNTVINAQHVTAHGVSSLAQLSGSPGRLTLTNSILVNVSGSTNNVLGSYLGTNGTPAIPGGSGNVPASLSDFQVSVGGHYYLADSSALRDAGTTNIVSALRTEITRSTTYAPIFFTNAITTDATWTPLYRDQGLPDLGYHYAPLDYIVSHCVIRSNAVLTLTNGVAVGVDYTVLDSDFFAAGFILSSGGFVSSGSATAMNAIVRAHNVQESWRGNAGAGYALFYDNAPGDPTQGDSQARFRFTQLAIMVDDGYMFYGYGSWKTLEWTHCDLYYAGMGLGDSANQVITLTNNIFDRSGIWAAPSGSGARVHVRNNTMVESYLSVTGGTTNWTIQDNLFDRMAQLTSSGNLVSHNAYHSNSVLSGTLGSDVLLTNLTYQRGALGKYYVATNLAVLNAGSRNATNAGLYHFTMTTNNVKETNSVVDMGFHYVATDANGTPLDYDGDGVPDYWEDWNGNGGVDSGETDWRDANDQGLRIYITRPKSNSVIP